MDMSNTTGTITGQYGAQQLASSGKTYFAWGNWWGNYTNQTETVKGLSMTIQNPSNTSTNNNNPIGFPSIFIGQYGGNKTVKSNLPKAVSALTTVPTIFKTNSSTIGRNNHNAAYDVWITPNANLLPATQHDPGAGGAFLMVWMYKPSDRQPRGSNAHPGQTVSGVSGNWDVWIDNSSNPPCISYVSTQGLDGLEFDLNDFIKDSVSKNYGVTNSMYLNVVFAGFEIWGGNNGLEINQFCVDVN